MINVDSSKIPNHGFIPTDTESRKKAYELFLQNGVLGYTYKENGLNIALFANSLNEGRHQRDKYALMSNFIFSNASSNKLYELNKACDQYECKDAGCEKNIFEADYEEVSFESVSNFVYCGSQFSFMVIF